MKLLAAPADSDWVVEIDGYMPEIFKAKSAGQARYRALLQFREAYGRRYTFADLWARGIKARRAMPADLITRAL